MKVIAAVAIFSGDEVGLVGSVEESSNKSFFGDMMSLIDEAERAAEIVVDDPADSEEEKLDKHMREVVRQKQQNKQRKRRNTIIQRIKKLTKESKNRYAN